MGHFGSVTERSRVVRYSGLDRLRAPVIGMDHRSQ